MSINKISAGEGAVFKLSKRVTHGPQPRGRSLSAR